MLKSSGVFLFGLMLAATDGVFAQDYWQPAGLDSMSVLDLAIDSSGNVLAGGNGLYRSTDDGNSWTQISTYAHVRCLAVSLEGVLMAGVWNEGLYRSSDNGSNWTRVLSIEDPLDFAVNSKGYVFHAAGDERDSAHGGGIYRSTDNGESWSFQFGYSTSALGCNASGDIFALSSNYHGTEMRRSSDGGTSWAIMNIIDSTGYGWPMAIAHGPNHKMYCAANGVWFSTDDGITWEHILADQAAFVLAIGTDGTIFVGTAGNGVLRSTNDGVTWDSINAGLTNRWILTLAVSPGGHLFAGTENGLYRSVSTVTTAIKNPGSAPTSFTLSQNYPNPFNPTTTIRYGLAGRSQVSLTVFNTLGQQVAVLQDGEKEAGYHEVTFDAGGLASGAYLYRLQAGDFVQSKKLILLR
jgi:photosystem II stability/assembly factor-like uncharacterized protein